MEKVVLFIDPFVQSQASEDPMFAGEGVIDASGISPIPIASVRIIKEKVISEVGRTLYVWGWPVSEEFLRHRINPIGGDNVIGNSPTQRLLMRLAFDERASWRGSASALGVPTRWAIAIQLCWCRDGREASKRRPEWIILEGKEEKRPILPVINLRNV